MLSRRCALFETFGLQLFDSSPQFLTMPGPLVNLVSFASKA